MIVYITSYDTTVKYCVCVRGIIQSDLSTVHSLIFAYIYNSESYF